MLTWTNWQLQQKSFCSGLLSPSPCLPDISFGIPPPAAGVTPDISLNLSSRPGEGQRWQFSNCVALIVSQLSSWSCHGPGVSSTGSEVGTVPIRFSDLGWVCIPQISQCMQGSFCFTACMHAKSFHTVNGVLKARILKWLAIPFSSGRRGRRQQDEMVGWHHWLNGHQFGQAPGVGVGQGSLACYSLWGRKESDMTEQPNWMTLSCFSHVRLFVTPWTIAHQAPLSKRFSRQEYWSGLPFPPPGDLPHPGIELPLSHLLHWQEGSLSLVSPGKPFSSI